MRSGPAAFLCLIVESTPVAASPLVVIGDGEDVAAAMSRAGRDVVGPAGARDLLAARARVTASDPSAARELADRGRAAYSSAEFTEAIDLLSQAAEGLYATGLRDVPLAEVATVHLDLGIAYLATRRAPEAEREMTLALRLKRDVSVDPVHGPPVRRALERIRAGLGSLPTFQRTVVSDPAGASVEVDGASRGEAPLTLDLAAGSHLVVFRARGRNPVVQRVEAGGPSRTPLAVALSVASPAQAALDALDAGSVEDAAALILTSLDADAVVAVRRDGTALRGTLLLHDGSRRTTHAATAADLVAGLLPPPVRRQRAALPEGQRRDLVPRSPATQRQASGERGGGTWWIWAGGAALAASAGALAYFLLSSGGGETPDQMELLPIVDQ